MGTMLRNPEYRAIAFRIMLFLMAMEAMLAIVHTIQLNALQARVVEQSAAVIGKVLAAHPELENDVIGAVVAPAAAHDIRRGRQALAAHGYDEAVPVRIDPILAQSSTGIYASSMGLMAVCAAVVLLLVTGGYSRIYRQVRAISNVAEKVVEGDFSNQLPAGGEGDFAILGHRFNQMASRLRMSMEQLLAEKVLLRNTISDISHQLKTPLSSLVVYNDLLMENEGMDAGQRSDFLALGRKQLQRLEWLIQNLLKMARLEAGSVQFRRDTVKLRDVAECAASALRTMAGEAGISIEIREEQPEACFAGDEAWLTEAVINIVKNGIEHSRAGCSVTIAVDQTPLTATVSIRDRGMGIDQADLPHIFERFYRSASSVKPDSIGIGLAMSKAIVEGQGGSITVRSGKGAGSEFVLTFLKTLGKS